MMPTPSIWHSAIDAGTSCVKCVALDASRPAEVMVIGSLPVSVERREPGLAEVRPAEVLAATFRLLDLLNTHAAAAGAEVKSLGLTGQVGGAICLDDSDQPLAPCMTWEDSRCAEQADAFDTFLAGRKLELLGVELPRGVCWPAPKLRWMREHAPDVLARARSVMQLKDLIFFHLTGWRWSEAISFIGLANVDTGRFDADVVRWCGIDASILPELHPAGATAPLRESMRSRWPALSGGSEPMHVGVGTADMKSSFFGCDLHPGEAFLLANTAEIVGQALPTSPVPAPAGTLKLRDAPGIDVVYGSTTNGGGSIEWFRHIAGELPIEALLAEAEAAPAGSDGLIFVPYLAGERAPLWRSDLSGAFVGLRASHTRGHLARSILEGCAFSKRHVLDLTRALGSPRLLKLAGGTARSMLWNRIRAAVLGLPARVLPSVETAALGAIFLSASHIDPTLRERYSKVSISEMIVPDPIWQSVYVEAYGRYLACAVRA